MQLTTKSSIALGLDFFQILLTNSYFKALMPKAFLGKIQNKFFRETI